MMARISSLASLGWASGGAAPALAVQAVEAPQDAEVTTEELVHGEALHMVIGRFCDGSKGTASNGTSDTEDLPDASSVGGTMLVRPGGMTRVAERFSDDEIAWLTALGRNVRGLACGAV